jgi:hypothetical protein
MKPTYEISAADDGVAIEITGVGERRDGLLAAFGECAEGRCSCPTNEYEKLEAMDIQPAADAVAIHLQAKAGTTLNPDEISRCLDYTVERASE